MSTTETTYTAAGYQLRAVKTEDGKTSIGVIDLDNPNLRNDAGVLFLEILKIAESLELRVLTPDVKALAFFLGTGGRGNLWFAANDSAELPIVAELKTAISARKDTLSALRERIANLLAPLPIGVKLMDKDAEDNVRIGDGLVCKVVRIYTGASQWANRTWDVTIKGVGYLTADGKLLAVNCDQSHWDGNNMHNRSTEPYVLNMEPDSYEDATNSGLKWASGRETRELALRLPAALARYMTACAAEQSSNEKTL